MTNKWKRMKSSDIASQRFGKLVAIERAGTDVGGVNWLCRCDCGGSRVARWSKLTKGIVTRCRECRSPFRRSPEYRAWRDMRKRCDNPKHQYYSCYGGRGIRICDRWSDFAAFIEDMGLRPSPQHSLDRIDNNGNYEKDNCRWATRAEQSRNKRNNVVLTHGGESKCITDWAKTIGIAPATLRARLIKGWATEKALTTPTDKNRRTGVRA